MSRHIVSDAYLPVEELIALGRYLRLEDRRSRILGDGPDWRHSDPRFVTPRRLSDEDAELRRAQRLAPELPW